MSPTLQSAAAVFDGPRLPLRLQSLPVPPLGSGEVLVRVTCCAICGSDLHTMQGRRLSPAPSVLGHEAIGRIEAIGSSAHLSNGVRIGDRVTWSMVASCGACFFCKKGLPQKCESLFKYGHERIQPDRGPSGGLSEFCVLRPGTAIFGIPNALPDLVACPANCATATVTAVFREIGELAGSTILIQGAGMLGLTASAMAHAAGAAVILIDPDERRLAIAKRFGALHTFMPSAPEEIAASVRDETSGRGVDAALEFAGSPDSLELALPLLRVGGRYLLAGAVFPSKPAGIDPEWVVRRIIRIQGVHNYAPRDLAMALEFLVQYQDRYPFETLVGKTFPLAQADAAFQFAIGQRPPRVAVIPSHKEA